MSKEQPYYHDDLRYYKEPQRSKTPSTARSTDASAYSRATSEESLSSKNLLSDFDAEVLADSSKQDWSDASLQNLFNSAPQISLVNDLGTLARRAYDKSKDQHKCQNGDWQFVKDSSMVQVTGGYYAQLWVNHETKKIVLMNAGTKLELDKLCGAGNHGIVKCIESAMNLFKDVVNDIQLAMNHIPTQYKRGVEKFVDTIMEDGGLVNSLRLTKDYFSQEDLKDYEFICSGHSLGAALSDCAALYLHFHKYDCIFKSLKSITLENPGSHDLMTTLHKSLSTRMDTDITLNDIESKYIVVNNKPNLINRALKQFGQVFTTHTLDETPSEIAERAATSMYDALTHLWNEVWVTREDHSEQITATATSIREVHQDTWGHGAYRTHLLSIYAKISDNSVVQACTKLPPVNYALGALATLGHNLMKVPVYDKAIDCYHGAVELCEKVPDYVYGNNDTSDTTPDIDTLEESGMSLPFFKYTPQN